MDSTLSLGYQQEMRFKAHRICSDNLGGSWSLITPAQLSLKPISGGMSNSLYCCSLPKSVGSQNGEPSQVLLRLYGEQWRNCDMSTQLGIFHLLSMKDLGPKLYGKFDDGRLEEFLPAESLTSSELRNDKISAIIAKKLATVHSLDVSMDRAGSWLIDRCTEWLHFIREHGLSPNFSEQTRESTIKIAHELMAVNYSEEIKFLRGMLDRTRSPIVFSHNDLHQGNILLAKRTKRRPTLEDRIVLIDFEYCSYNHRAYDIANHFSEWCFEYDTPEYPHFRFSADRFPSKDAQRDFVRHYLEQRRKLIATSEVTLSSMENGIENTDENSRLDNRRTSNNTNRNGHSNSVKAETEEIAMMSEIKPFFMAANLLWSLWCIKSAQKSTIKFGYWEHAMTRWRLYMNFKASYMKAQTNGDKISWNKTRN